MTHVIFFLVQLLYEIWVSTPRVVRVLSNNKQQLQIILFRSRQQSSVRIPYLGAATPNVETNTYLLILKFSQHRYRLFLVLLAICKYVVIKSIVFSTKLTDN